MTDVFGRLVTYARSRQLPPPCYRMRRVDWVLDIDESGLTVSPYGDLEAVPTVRRSGTRPMPLLAVDNAACVLAASGVGMTARQAQERAAAFWAQMGAWAAGPNGHTAVIAALALTQIHGPAQSDHEIPPRSNVAVRVAGIWLHRLPQAVAEWNRIVQDAKGSPARGICVACAEVRQLAATLPNAIPSRLLPGAEQDAQLTVLPMAERGGPDAHLPVCVPCADLAAAALQALLEDPDHSARLPGQDSAVAVFGLGPDGADEAAVALFAKLGAW